MKGLVERRDARLSV